MSRSAISMSAGAGLLLLAACGSAATNWYAAGRAFVIQDNKVDTSRLIGPPGIVRQWCREVLRTGEAPVPPHVPAAKSVSAAREWLQGCIAAYKLTHPSATSQARFACSTGSYGYEMPNGVRTLVFTDGRNPRGQADLRLTAGIVPPGGLEVKVTFANGATATSTVHAAEFRAGDVFLTYPPFAGSRACTASPAATTQSTTTPQVRPSPVSASPAANALETESTLALRYAEGAVGGCLQQAWLNAGYQSVFDQYIGRGMVQFSTGASANPTGSYAQGTVIDVSVYADGEVMGWQGGGAGVAPHAGNAALEYWGCAPFSYHPRPAVEPPDMHADGPIDVGCGSGGVSVP